MAITLSLVEARQTEITLHLEGANPPIVSPVGRVAVRGSISDVAQVEFPVAAIQVALGLVRVFGSGSGVTGRPRTLIAAPTGRIFVAGMPAYVAGAKTFIPITMFPGMSSDGTAISFSISDFPGLAALEADATDGDWREVFQALLMRLHDHMESYENSGSEPQTVHLFMLEDWNRKDSRFGRHMKRLFLVEFTVENAPTNIFDTE